MYKQIDSNKRMSVLLITLFIIVIIALGYFYDILTGDQTYSGVIIAIIISLVMTLISYYQGDKIALWSTGAQAISKEQNSYVYNLVENLCITSGLPVPKIYVINDPAINAFATGRKPELASIAVTTGAIEKLENEELEGVLAHEMAHVKNFDIRFMMLVAILVGAITILSDIFIRGRFFGRKSSNNNGGGILIIVGIILAILSPLIAELIKLAISRRREYLADADGSLLTRYPEGLARALEKIALKNQPMAKASSATAHLFISNPFGSSRKFANLFSTHPPIEERIAKLRTMA